MAAQSSRTCKDVSGVLEREAQITKIVKLPTQDLTPLWGTRSLRMPLESLGKGHPMIKYVKTQNLCGLGGKDRKGTLGGSDDVGLRNPKAGRPGWLSQ